MVYLSKPKTTSLSKAKKKAWQWCSKYIRLRDATEYCRSIGLDLSPNDRIGQCCTCGVIRNWKKMDAGHFISRGLGGSSGVYFDERNINLQCKQCNGLKQGNAQAYEDFMVGKYGPRVVDELRLKNRLVHRYTVIELEATAQFYKEKFEELKK